jgi:hypothetical protein
MIESPKLIAVAGLPGSSKSHYIHHEAKEFGYRAVSDITQCGWLSWPVLLNFLRDGETCITDSATFTTAQGRKDLEYRLKKDFGEAGEVEWRFFENNPTACLTNIIRDGILKPEREFHVRLQRLFERSPSYVVPDGYAALPVYAPQAVELPYGSFEVKYL